MSGRLLVLVFATSSNSHEPKLNISHSNLFKIKAHTVAAALCCVQVRPHRLKLRQRSVGPSDAKQQFCNGGEPCRACSVPVTGAHTQTAALGQVVEVLVSLLHVLVNLGHAVLDALQLL